MDGTFETCPDLFAQIYVIHGSGGHDSKKLYPCAYALLPQKDGSSYKALFHCLKDIANISPKGIIIDFEQAVIKSAKAIFGKETKIYGCRFHRKKNLFFQVGQKGCLELFHHNEDFQV